MRRALALSLFLTLGLPGTPHAQADVSPDALPAELRGWQDWVLDGREHLRCPYLGGADASAPDGRICAWPGPVAIDAGETGARFAQDLQMYAPGFAPVPGDVEYWPQDVEVDGRATPVIERGGRPHLRLERGTHRIAGRLVWARMPESIPLPSSVSLVELRVNGASIALPERSGDRLRLGAARVQAQANQLEVQVYRKLTDSLPGVLETRVLLNVAGQAREELLGPILPPGFVPMHLTGPLPARLQPDGRLRVQVRPGSFPLALVSRSASALEAVRLPEAGLSEEVWSFEAVDRLRSAAVEGVPSIDPAQANVPGEWQSLPAYRLSPGSELRIVERSRGLGGEDQNRVNVERQLWWDFDGSGYTFQDFVGGRMQQDWRLEMSPPYLLQGARQEGQPLLVTQREEGRAGVELRSPELGMEATGRLEKRGGAIPAAGWDTRLTSLGVTLQLPPGHRLLAAPGVDESASAWLNRWRLLDIFIVLLVTAAAFRVAGVPAAALALAALTLTHHELSALTWGVLNLVIAIGLARAVPDGRLRRWAGIWRAVSVAVVVLMLVPFALSQARLAFFPQLESSGLIEMPLSARERTASPPSAAPMDVEGQVMEARDAALAGAADAVSQITVTAAKRIEAYDTTGSLMQRYAPGTLLQNGPGVPQWNYQSHRLLWGGPVEPTQTLRLIVLRPFWVSLWRLAGIVLLSLTLYALLRNAYPRIGQPLIDRWLRLAPAAAALLAMALPLAAPDARAETPSAELLGELQRRLSRPPKCEPDCVAVARAQLRLAGGVLEIRLEAHAQALAVLALPEAAQRWQPQQVLLDGAPASGLARDSSGTLVLALAPGVHTVSMRGPVPEADALRLVFRERPARIGVDAPGWQVAGVDEERLLADSVNLIRAVVARADAGADRTAREEFPPFVRVTRTLRLGLDWTVTTDVQRLAPAQGAFSLRLPLLAGESVLTAGLPARDGHVDLSMPAGVDHAGWTSTLARAESISLAAPAAAPYVETWRFEAGPIWHLAFEGTPEVLGLQQDGPSWVHHFEPRSAESLEVTVTRPAAVAGPTFAFERVRHALTPGRRSTDTTLEIDYRSTQGERHVLQLPEGARLQSILADGEPLLLRDQDGELALPLQPGEHQLQIAWQADVGTSLVTRPGAVGLGAPASNVRTTIAVPANRWLLFAAGGGVGPAILYWAELAVFIVLALLLGRLRRTPLATHEWLLVGLGLSTFSWSVLLLFAVWVFVFEWRSRWTADTRPWVFNGVQVLLVLLTVAALGSLLAAIPNGLLGSPDMRVAGAGSHGGLLDWFHDRVDQDLPQPFVISVSIWFYKAAMLAWALWLSFALVRWVRWAWQAGSAQGFWRGRRTAAPQIG